MGSNGDALETLCSRFASEDCRCTVRWAMPPLLRYQAHQSIEMENLGNVTQQISLTSQMRGMDTRRLACSSPALAVYGQRRRHNQIALCRSGRTPCLVLATAAVPTDRKVAEAPPKRSDAKAKTAPGAPPVVPAKPEAASDLDVDTVLASELKENGQLLFCQDLSKF